MTPSSDPDLQTALARLRAGDLVLLYDGDGREEETDLFIAGHAITPDVVRTMRRDGGGLVFVAVDPAVADALGLPFLHDVLHQARDDHPILERLVPEALPYDARSSFSIPVNHRDTYTGITDEDRARTVSALADLARDLADLDEEAARARFAEEFRTPGHVHLCVAADGLLEARRGHTELAVALARMAGVPPIVAGVEMMAPGRALPRDEAAAWARDHGTVLLDGRQVLDAWRKREADERDMVVGP